MSSPNIEKKEVGLISTFQYPGLKTKCLLLQKPGRMLSFYPGKHFLNFIHWKEDSLCITAETIENTVSWLSEKHYLNKINRLGVLSWK